MAYQMRRVKNKATACKYATDLGIRVDHTKADGVKDFMVVHLLKVVGEAGVATFQGPTKYP
jgi:hypothetical protein